METNLWLKHVSRARRPSHSAAGLPAPAGATSALPAPTPQGNTAVPGRRRKETHRHPGPRPRRSPQPRCRTGSVTAPLRLAREARRRFWPFLPLTSGRQPRCPPPPAAVAATARTRGAHGGRQLLSPGAELAAAASTLLHLMRLQMHFFPLGIPRVVSWWLGK